MRIKLSKSQPFLPLIFGLLGNACSEAPSPSDGLTATGGTSSTGGAPGNGAGPASGGNGLAAGGATSTGGTSGGAPASGGEASSSGGAQTGGGPSSGGESSDGPAGGGTTGGNASGGNAPGGGGGAQAASGGESSGGAGASGGAGLGDGPIRLITVGDSITQSTCWRALLWEGLARDHAGRFDFVGTQKNDSGCSPSGYDRDTESYGSSLLTQAISGNFSSPSKTCNPKAASTGNCPALVDFQNAFDQVSANLALIHYGTNDIWENRSADSIINGYSQLIDALRAVDRAVVVLVAQIIPLAGSACSSCASTVPELNSAIAAWAPTKATPTSPVVVVDQFTGFEPSADTNDGVHPNDQGSRKLADRWREAIDGLL